MKPNAKNQAADRPNDPTQADTTSPTFVAQFADGIMTRMTCHCASDHLDLARGIKLSRAAYESRIRKLPPAIIKASFVKPFSNETIESYDQAMLK